jgi:hypothetical protein
MAVRVYDTLRASDAKAIYGVYIFSINVVNFLIKLFFSMFDLRMFFYG